ncbi:MAG: hypothetical protein KDD52_05250 [Bdellovibrionales bacterium]|nr:hypothetical protein [Bdellovibrionales bacterium]
MLITKKIFHAGVALCFGFIFSLGIGWSYEDENFSFQSHNKEKYKFSIREKSFFTKYFIETLQDSRLKFKKPIVVRSHSVTDYTKPQLSVTRCWAEDRLCYGYGSYITIEIREGFGSQILGNDATVRDDAFELENNILEQLLSLDEWSNLILKRFNVVTDDVDHMGGRYKPDFPIAQPHSSQYAMIYQWLSIFKKSPLLKEMLDQGTLKGIFLSIAKEAAQGKDGRHAGAITPSLGGKSSYVKIFPSNYQDGKGNPSFITFEKTLVHELGHWAARGMNENELKLFVQRSSENCVTSSAYGNFSPGENFAVTFEEYFLDPKKLMGECPQKLELLYRALGIGVLSTPTLSNLGIEIDNGVFYPFFPQIFQNKLTWKKAPPLDPHMRDLLLYRYQAYLHQPVSDEEYVKNLPVFWKTLAQYYRRTFPNFAASSTEDVFYYDLVNSWQEKFPKHFSAMFGDFKYQKDSDILYFDIDPNYTGIAVEESLSAFDIVGYMAAFGIIGPIDNPEEQEELYDAYNSFKSGIVYGGADNPLLHYLEFSQILDYEAQTHIGNPKNNNYIVRSNIELKSPDDRQVPYPVVWYTLRNPWENSGPHNDHIALAFNPRSFLPTWKHDANYYMEAMEYEDLFEREKRISGTNFKQKYNQSLSSNKGFQDALDIRPEIVGKKEIPPCDPIKDQIISQKTIDEKIHVKRIKENMYQATIPIDYPSQLKIDNVFFFWKPIEDEKKEEKCINQPNGFYVNEIQQAKAGDSELTVIFFLPRVQDSCLRRIHKAYFSVSRTQKNCHDSKEYKISMSLGDENKHLVFNPPIKNNEDLIKVFWDQSRPIMDEKASTEDDISFYLDFELVVNKNIDMRKQYRFDFTFTSNMEKKLISEGNNKLPDEIKLEDVDMDYQSIRKDSNGNYIIHFRSDRPIKVMSADYELSDFVLFLDGQYIPYDNKTMRVISEPTNEDVKKD